MGGSSSRPTITSMSDGAGQAQGSGPDLSVHFKNTYKPSPHPPPDNLHEHTPAKDYEHNFAFGVKVIKSDRVLLLPLTPVQHGQQMFDAIQAEPALSRWLPFSFNEYKTLLTAYEMDRKSPDTQNWAIYTDSTDPSDPPSDPWSWRFAGQIGLSGASPGKQTAEIGALIIMPEFQRTHVNTHATGLLMRYILDSPSEGGCGLRAVTYKAHDHNAPSINAATRMGFTGEGIHRVDGVLPVGKEGSAREAPFPVPAAATIMGPLDAARPGNKYSDRPTRDAWVGSVTWQEWENGVKEHVRQQMARRH